LALQASYDIAGNLGVAEIDAGKHRQAVEHLVFALRHFPVGASQESIERLLRLIATERMQVVILVVEVNLAGAEVFVDDKRIGAAPLRDELFLEPGPRRIEARQKGYVTARGERTRRNHHEAEITTGSIFGEGAPALSVHPEGLRSLLAE
jgi:hypothetical protein